MVLSADGQQLFFTDDTHDKELVYVCSKKTDGQWSAPAEVPLLNTNDTYNFIASCQPDFMLKGGLSYSRGTGESGYAFLDKNYQPMGLLKIAAYANYDETSSACVTSDRKVLVMGLETDMTQGGHDLYYATMKEDGTYSYLQNLGKVVNSAGDEESPCLLSDQHTLLFSSDGFSSLGENDIYVSYRLDDTWKKWSAPVNLGSKVNSDSYDGAPFYDEKHEILYYITTTDGKQVIKAIAISKDKLVPKP